MSLASKTLRILLGLIFIAAAVSKAAYPLDFAQIVANYRILPDDLVNPVALFLPWLELVCGAALVAGVAVRGAALTVVLMLTVFLGALGYNAARGISVGCGCFSVAPGAVDSMHADMVRDALILVLALVVLTLGLIEERRRRASARFWKEFYAPPKSVFNEPDVQNGVLFVGQDDSGSEHRFGVEPQDAQDGADEASVFVADGDVARETGESREKSMERGEAEDAARPEDSVAPDAEPDAEPDKKAD